MCVCVFTSAHVCLCVYSQLHVMHAQAKLVSTSFDAEDASKDQQLLRSLGWNVAGLGAQENVFGSRLLERSRDDASRIIRCNALLLHSTS
jgi:hypothetical protein